MNTNPNTLLSEIDTRFKIEHSIVCNKRIAPAGCIFVIVTYKDKMRKLFAAQMVKGRSDGVYNDVENILVHRLIIKYNLTGD